MSMITVDMVGDKEISATFERLQSKTDGRVAKVNERYANLLLERIRQNIIALDIYETGDYHDSWTVTKVEGGRGVGGFIVSTDRPDAYRHEHGFVGRDSLGRMYHTFPRPHVRPAQEATYDEWSRAVRMEVLAIWRR
jgi:hypothetical protein